jgi:acetyl esterase/lipase
MTRTGLLALGVLLLSTIETTRQEPPAKPRRAGGRISDQVAVELDVEYGRAGDRSLKLDLLRPKDQGEKVLPVVVFVHGGGWRNGGKENGRFKMSDLAATGNYVGVTVGYRLTGEAGWPAQIHDCKAAIRWIRANADKYHLDSNHIGAWGHSAGAHLVSLLGTSGDVKELEGDDGSPGYSSRVQCVVDSAGPCDFLSFVPQKPDTDDRKDALSALFPGSPSERKEMMRVASPVTWVSADDPPFLVVHGTVDKLPIAQAEGMVAALKKVNVPVTFIRMEGGGHGVFGQEINSRARAFFDKHLRGQSVEVSTEPIPVATR